MIRPHIRIPLWAAAAVPAVAYIIRSSARGLDFAPDMPDDLLLFGALGGLMLLVARFRAATADEGDDDLTNEMHGEDSAADSER